MSYRLELQDIQGNIVRAYGRYSYPFARYFFLNIADPARGRAFVGEVAKRVTTSARWPDAASRPKCTVNIGFTFFGLYRLGLPMRTLQSLPEEFIAGMKDRAFLLGDRDMTRSESEDAGWDSHWDPIWRGNRRGDGFDADNVHVWISMNAQLRTPGTADPVDELETGTEWLRGLCAASGGGVRILATNGRNGDQEYHAASAVFQRHGGALLPTPNEHFGFADGIGDPVFKGQYPPEDEKVAVIGRGKRMGNGWEPIEAGEFILGHPDESQEVPPTAAPSEFMTNGSFMAYRKLHQNVASFAEVVADEAARYAKIAQVPQDEAEATLKAKICGRWPDGIPLAVAPTCADRAAVRKRHGLDDPDPVRALEKQIAYIRSPAASDFRYADDMQGLRTPGGAHLRRSNPRDYLDPLNAPEGDNPDATTALNKRRRILRRGLPYGPPPETPLSDATEQGVTMMIVGASLFRQFEFVQQQWIQYGLDFHQGNHTCPMLGDHRHHRRFTIPGDRDAGTPTYVMGGLRTFVECRGGDYFFVPSMTALRMIAMGIVDPT